MGEATKNLSKNFTKKHSNVEWRELAELRDKLIHHYFGINWKRVWNVVKNLIPKIEDKLRKTLE